VDAILISATEDQEMTRTPGPWKWWTSCSWRRLRHDDRGKSVDVLMPCVAPDGQPDIIVSKDDMPLIEAAPDLLAALKQLLAGHYATWMADRGEVEGFRASQNRFEEKPEVIASRAAIAKAEGKP
jgi:hypothetical protein